MIYLDKSQTWRSGHYFVYINLDVSACILESFNRTSCQSGRTTKANTQKRMAMQRKNRLVCFAHWLVGKNKSKLIDR